MESLLLIRGAGTSDLLLGLAVILGATYVAWKYVEAKRSPLNAIPTVGYSGVLTSYITALRWQKHTKELLQEGYERYSGRPFKVATMSKWVVVFSGVKYVDEIRMAPIEVLNFRAEIAERFQIRYTLGRQLGDDQYHIEVIRSLLTRNLGNRFNDIWDETLQCFKDYVPMTEEWQAVGPMYNTSMKMVCRISNRLFVGLPLCRHPGYRSLIENFTVDVASDAKIINSFPDFLKPLVGRYLTRVPKRVNQLVEYLGPTIEGRLEQEKLHGSEWDGKPNDLISWLLEMATQEHNFAVHDIAMRILAINFAANHNTSMSFTHALYNLALHPECVEPMRQEVEAIIKEEGLTKRALSKMRKVDSFLKESQRLSSAATMRLWRKALQDFMFSDGTFIRAGTTLAVAVDAMNKNEDYFPDATTFNGFRFADMRDGSGEFDSIRHQMVALGMEQITFGHGRHSCPGRFFAVNELKAMFAHLLLNYDVQLENGCMERPPDRPLEIVILPNPEAKVMFRKRKV